MIAALRGRRSDLFKHLVSVRKEKWAKDQKNIDIQKIMGNLFIRDCGEIAPPLDSLQIELLRHLFSAAADDLREACHELVSDKSFPKEYSNYTNLCAEFVGKLKI